jgi:hypothetical protein
MQFAEHSKRTPADSSSPAGRRDVPDKLTVSHLKIPHISWLRTRNAYGNFVGKCAGLSEERSADGVGRRVKAVTWLNGMWCSDVAKWNVVQ